MIFDSNRLGRSDELICQLRRLNASDVINDANEAIKPGIKEGPPRELEFGNFEIPPLDNSLRLVQYYVRTPGNILLSWWCVVNIADFLVFAFFH